MMNVSETIFNKTGLKLQVDDSVVLRNGRRVERAYISLGKSKLAVMLIEVDESFNLSKGIKDIIQLAEYERIIIHSTHFLKDQMDLLKEKGIGYIDNNGHYYIPLDLVSNESFHSEEKKEKVRSSSTLNEFPIGYLFFKNYGLLELTQAEIGNLIGKSAATVNLTLKNMEKENLIVKTDNGYHLANIETYFERWRFIISQFKVKKEYGRFSSKLDDIELKELCSNKLDESLWALSGPRVDCIKGDGYLDNAKEMSIFLETKSQKRLYKNLKLIPNNSGDIVLYPSLLDLRDSGQFAHDIVVSAELMNSSNSRIREAGENRLSKYLSKAKKVVDERYSGRSF
jgi:hypothetical protein